MKSVALKAYPRSQVQRAEVKKLRATGRVPATIYGRQAKPQNLEVNSKELRRPPASFRFGKLARGFVRGKRRALQAPRARAGNPASPARRQGAARGFPRSFAENEKVTVHVPLETTGEAAGVKTGGGVLEHILHKLKVRCLPKDLPEQIIVDVSASKSASPFTLATSRRRRALKFWATSTFPSSPSPRRAPRKKWRPPKPLRPPAMSR